MWNDDNKLGYGIDSMGYCSGFDRMRPIEYPTDHDLKRDLEITRNLAQDSINNQAKKGGGRGSTK